MSLFKKYKTVIALGLIVLLPLLQLLFFYLIAMETGLPGRRGGPQDAFRHTYASAIVAKYLSPKVVELVTNLSERNANSPHDAMDIHNNTIGIQIGLTSKNIYEAVKARVDNGGVNSKEKNRTTWLLEDMWTNGF